MQGGWVRAAIVSCDSHVEVIRVLFIFGVLSGALARMDEAMDLAKAYLDEHIPVTIFIEDTSIHELVFWLLPVPALVLRDQLFVREPSLRVLVEVLHVGVRGRGVEVVVELLDIFTVVSLMASNTEKTLLEDGILAIPERKTKAETLVVIRHACHSVFTPSVSARSRMLVREVGPSVSVCRVVFANRGLEYGRLD